MKNALKRGDMVTVIAGDSRGKAGKILRVLRKENRVIVEGVAVVKKHMRKSQEYPEGAIAEKSMPIAASNVMLKVIFDRRGGKRNKSA
ncbi:MAG: 50S ribosomal protein L24 [Puniceicoccales bacterium]|jgi:large subunit ribosomal protein L24|nr:50S ribosomal protein L24 [Puniceicoccales bacterium]